MGLLYWGDLEQQQGQDPHKAVAAALLRVACSTTSGFVLWCAGINA